MIICCVVTASLYTPSCKGDGSQLHNFDTFVRVMPCHARLIVSSCICYFTCLWLSFCQVWIQLFLLAGQHASVDQCCLSRHAYSFTLCVLCQVLGVYADYYIFETTVKEQPEEEEEKLGQCLFPFCASSLPHQEAVACSCCTFLCQHVIIFEGFLQKHQIYRTCFAIAVLQRLQTACSCPLQHNAITRHMSFNE